MLLVLKTRSSASPTRKIKGSFSTNDVGTYKKFLKYNNFTRVPTEVSWFEPQAKQNQCRILPRFEQLLCISIKITFIENAENKSQHPKSAR